jgi:hypothetical protein
MHPGTQGFDCRISKSLTRFGRETDSANLNDVGRPVHSPDKLLRLRPDTGKSCTALARYFFDDTTGAVITPTNIELHIVDDGRGDDDLQPDGSITHTGAPVTITATTTTSDNSSCSLSRTPAGIPRAGDWGVVALFLAVLAGIRARRESTSAS